MPHPDQKYIDGIVNHDPYTLRLIYEEYAPRVIRLVINSSKNAPDSKTAGSTAKNISEGIGARAADVFRRALVSIRYKAKLPSFSFACSFSELILNECEEIINKKIRFFLPERHEQRIGMIKEALLKLDTACQKILNQYWNAEAPKEFYKGMEREERRDLNKKEGRKKNSACMQKLIEALDPKFNLKK